MNEINNNSFKLSLGKVLNIERVNDFYSQNAISMQCQNLIIDASEIEQIDTAGLQLVLYYVIELKKRKATITWDPSPSDPLVEKARRAGFVEALDIIRGEMSCQ